MGDVHTVNLTVLNRIMGRGSHRDSSRGVPMSTFSLTVSFRIHAACATYATLPPTCTTALTRGLQRGYSSQRAAAVGIFLMNRTCEMVVPATLFDVLLGSACLGC